MKTRTVSACILMLLTAAAAVGGLWLARLDAGAQRAQTPLEIDEIRHTLVDDRSVILVEFDNTGQTALNASGDFALVNAEGIVIAEIEVSTGEIEAGQSSVVTVPLNTRLLQGRYTATLMLVDDAENVRANSGLREIVVGFVAPDPTPRPFPTGSPSTAVDDDSGGGGFPSWLLLLIGLTLTVAGVGYLRMTTSQRKPAAPRPIPEVSMVRKVKVASPPPKRHATIKPLLPPCRRED